MNRVCGAVAVVVCAGCVTIVKPAEPDNQDFVVMGTQVYEYTVDHPPETVQIQMIANMLPTVKVALVAQDDTEGDAFRDKLSDYGVPDSQLSNLVVFPIEHTDIWFRDMGGIFVKAFAPGESSLAVIDQPFNGWGYGPIQDDDSRALYAIDDQVAGELANQMGLPVITTTLIFEGGAITSNGAGTVMYSLQALTQRNPGMTQSQIETELKRILGAKKVIAMPVFHPSDGMSFLDGPVLINGQYYHFPFGVRHIDEIAAFADAHTIFIPQLAQADVTNDFEQKIHDTLTTAWNFLKTQTDQSGKPFTLIAFPDPGLVTTTLSPDDAMWQILGTEQGLQHYDPTTGGPVILPDSYINYVVTNGLVEVPMFYKPGRNPRLQDTDAAAISILQTEFPTRRIVPIDDDNVTVGGGGMHCITQEVVSLNAPPSSCGNGHP